MSELPATCPASLMSAPRCDPAERAEVEDIAGGGVSQSHPDARVLSDPRYIKMR